MLKILVEETEDRKSHNMHPQRIKKKVKNQAQSQRKVLRMRQIERKMLIHMKIDVPLDGAVQAEEGEGSRN